MADVDIKTISLIMMKYIFILLLSVVTFLSGKNLSDETAICVEQKAVCPEIEESDILRIHSFLTSPQFNMKRKKSNLKTYNFHLSDLERQHTDSFRAYWRKKGVEAVSDSNICKMITQVLNSNEHIQDYLNEFERIYYKVGNKYVILYRPRQKKRIIQKGTTPVQISDENFNIISNYKI